MAKLLKTQAECDEYAENLRAANEAAHKDKVSDYQKKWRKANREEQRAYSKKYREANLEKVREASKKYWEENSGKKKCYKLRNKYGITLEERDAMLTQQGNRCAVCRTDDPGTRDWHVDHCHDTGKIRGVLCHHCNHMLGHAKDNPDTLIKAISYLKSQDVVAGKDKSYGRKRREARGKVPQDAWAGYPPNQRVQRRAQEY